MAGLKLQIKGSTLVETLVSMVILLIISLGFFSCIYFITGTYRNNYRVYAYTTFQNHILKCDQGLYENNRKTIYPSFYVNSTLTQPEKNKNLYLYKVKLIDNDGKLVFSGQKYLLRSDIEND